MRGCEVSSWAREEYLSYGSSLRKMEETAFDDDGAWYPLAVQSTVRRERLNTRVRNAPRDG